MSLGRAEKAHAHAQPHLAEASPEPGRNCCPGSFRHFPLRMTSFLPIPSINLRSELTCAPTRCPCLSNIPLSIPASVSFLPPSRRNKGVHICWWELGGESREVDVCKAVKRGGRVAGEVHTGPGRLGTPPESATTPPLNPAPSFTGVYLVGCRGGIAVAGTVERCPAQLREASLSRGRKGRLAAWEWERGSFQSTPCVLKGGLEGSRTRTGGPKKAKRMFCVEGEGWREGTSG